MGPGALKNREDSKILGTSKESTLLQAQTGWYKTFAIECSRSQVSVDMWLFSSAYTDVATLSAFALFPSLAPEPHTFPLQAVSLATPVVRRITTRRSTLLVRRTRSSSLTNSVPSLPIRFASRLSCVFVLREVRVSRSSRPLRS